MKLGSLPLVYFSYMVFVPFDGYQEYSKKILPPPYLVGGSGPGEHPCTHFKYTGATPKFYWGEKEYLPFLIRDNQGVYHQTIKRAQYYRIRDIVFSISGRVVTITWNDEGHLGKWEHHLMDDKYYTYSYRDGKLINSWSNNYNIVSYDRVVWPSLRSSEEMAMILQHEPDSSIWSSLIAEACVNAKVNTNNIANAKQIIDVVKVVKDFKSKIGRIPGKLSKKATRSTCKELFGSAWLAKRYSVDTTLSDIDEIHRSFVESLNDVHVFRNGLRINNDAETYEYHSKSTLIPWVGGLQNINLLTHTDLQRLGLDPSLYNLWDMVPFSFVVDWFLPIGDAFEDISNNIWYGTMPYDVTNVVSFKHTHTAMTAGDASWSFYVRDTDFTITDFSVLAEKNKKISTRTWVKRSADAVALFY